MRNGFHAGRTITIGVAAVAFAAIGLTGILRCSRDNPLDSKSKSYIPGTPPQVRFLHPQDTLFGFIKDSITITVAYDDTEAAGGKTPKVENLHFNWTGDSTKDTDIVTAASGDSMTVTRYFTASRMRVYAYVRAKDNDSMVSPFARIKLVIDSGIPKINGLKVNGRSVVLDTVTAGKPDTISVLATDTNGTVRAFIWTVSGKDTVTQDSVIKLAFGTAGPQTVVVKVRDDDSIVSRADTVTVVVIDTVGPQIQFTAPHNGDIITSLSSTINVVVKTIDPSGTAYVSIDGTVATKIGGADTSTWQLNVTLVENQNTIRVMALDNSPRFNPSYDSITVTYHRPDITPPAIVFSTPQPRDTIRDTLRASSVTVVVTVTDQSRVAWVKCDTAAMSNPSGNSYTANVTLKTEGNDTLLISAADTVGNIDTVKLLLVLMVFRDTTPPSLRITYPVPDQQIAADSVLVIVYASDTAGPIRSGMDSVTIKGLRAPFNGVHYMLKVPLSHGSDTIRVAAFDSSGNRRNDRVIVIRNIPPHFVPDVQVKDTSLVVNVASIIPVCASDTESDTLTFGFITKPPKDTAATITKSGNCANIAYTATTTGLDTFRIRVTDSWGASDTLKIGVTVTSGNRPRFTNSTLPDSATVGALYSVQLTAVPADSPLVYSLVKPPTPDSVRIDSGTGRVTWTPASANLGKDSIIAVVRNSIGESDTLRWIVTVVLPDMPPRLQNPGDKNVTEGRLLQFTLVATDTNNDILIYSFGSTYPAGATLDSLSGAFSWTPTYRQGGQPPAAYPTVLKVTEKNRSPALSDSVTITIAVKDTNMAPVLVNPGNKIVDEMQLLAFSLQATDSNGDSISFSMGGVPAGALISNGTIFTWTPSGSQAGVYPIMFYATDNGSPPMRDSQAVTITVRDTTVPLFNPHPAMDTVLVGFPYITTVSATDGDNDSLTYTKIAGPDSLVIGAKNGVVAWTPKKADFNDTVTVSVTAQDPAGNLDTLTWTILVFRWPRIFWSPTMNDTGYSVIQTRDGGYALCGTIATASSNLGFLMRTDTSGNAYVFQTYPGTAGYVSLYSIQQTADNGFILCGSDSAAGETKMLLIKTDPAGAVQWLKTISDSRLTYPSAKGTCVALTSDGGFIACGVAIHRGIIGPLLAASDAYLVKTDPSGMVIWDSIYTNGTQASGAYSVQQTADKGYILSGEIATTGGTSTGTDLYLVKTNSFGSVLWKKTYGKGVRDVGLSVLEINGGTGGTGYIIGGFSTGNTGTNGVLMRVNASGDTVGGGWISSLAGNSVIASVRPTSDGNYVGCGFGTGRGEDVLLYKFTPTGGEVWSKLYGTTLSDRGYCAVQTADGGFVLTGFVTISGVMNTTTDIYLVKTDGKGNLEK